MTERVLVYVYFFKLDMCICGISLGQLAEKQISRIYLMFILPPSIENWRSKNTCMRERLLNSCTALNSSIQKKTTHTLLLCPKVLCVWRFRDHIRVLHTEHRMIVLITTDDICLSRHRQCELAYRFLKPNWKQPVCECVMRSRYFSLAASLLWKVCDVLLLRVRQHFGYLA